MKRTTSAVLAVALLILVGATGCVAGWRNEGAYWGRRVDRGLYQDTNSSQSAEDRMHSQKQVVDQDARALVDDIDFILLRERPTRLSRWHNR